MAGNPWKKYVIGIAGVTVIGSTVGLAQQLDSNKNMATTVLPTNTPSTQVQPTAAPEVSIDQQFAAAEVVTDTDQPPATVKHTTAPAPRKVMRQLAPTPPNEEYVWDDEDEDDDDDYSQSSGKLRSQAS